jgi:hypothetical protein
LKNTNALDSGIRQNGTELGDVGFPQWATSVEDFVMKKLCDPLKGW